jgi:hypothetical protein
MKRAANNFSLPALFRRTTLLGSLFLVVLTGVVRGARSSANYSVPADSIDFGGARAQSANYSINGSALGEFGASQNALVTSAAYTGKNGYVGELYDIVALSITAPPSSNLNELTSRQLLAAPLADDVTTLAAFDPSTVTWSVVAGPITSISSSGIATAANIYQDTLATVGGAAQNLSGQLNLTILDTNPDDYGIYANDGIPDSWQVQYFGTNNPKGVASTDADGTGQTNLFKYVAGLNPLDGSRFALSIQQVSGRPAQKNLIFQPLVSGRTYLVQFMPGLATQNWQTLTGTTQNDNGNQRTVTDLNATGGTRFYRVQISKP